MQAFFLAFLIFFVKLILLAPAKRKSFLEEKNLTPSELLAWAKIRKGNLRTIQRKNGIAYSFRYRLGGEVRSKNFPAGTDHNFIKSFIADIEAKILKEKLGLKDYSDELEWYIRAALKESLADKKEEARTYSIVTIEHSEWVFKRFITFLKSEDIPIDQIGKHHLYEYRRHLAEKGWVDRSIRQDIATVKAIFKKAFDEALLQEYPFWGFKMRRMTIARPRDLLTFAEMKKVLRAINDKYIRLACLLGMYGGFRLADILRMKRENINHEKKTITFWMAKRREWIEMPIRDELAKILSHFKGQTGPVIRVEHKRGSQKAYPNYIAQAMSRAIKKVKGKIHHRSGPHTFRHSFSHILELNEIPWPAQQFLLGHKIKEMTGRYSHLEKRLNYFRRILAEVDFNRKVDDDEITEIDK